MHKCDELLLQRQNTRSKMVHAFFNEELVNTTTLNGLAKEQTYAPQTAKQTFVFQSRHGEGGIRLL